MSKISIPAVPSGFATVTALNERFEQIEDALNDDVLWRSEVGAEPNAMQDELDMGSNKIINVDDATQSKDAVNLGQIGDLIAAAAADLGTGNGNVLGPSDSVDSEIALFNGTSGRLLKRGVPYSTVSTAITTLNNLSLANDKRLQVAKQKMLNGLTVKIVCLGDSITAGNASPNNYPEQLQTLLRAYYKNINITVVNAGSSGFTSTQLLAVWNANVVAQAPDIVVPMMGMNDTILNTGVQLFYDNIYELYRLATVAGYAVLSLNVTPHVSSSILGYERSYMYKDAMQSVSSRYGIRLLDIGKELQELYEGSGATPQSLISADGVHYSNQGYAEIAGIVFGLGLVGGDIVVTDGSKFGTQNSKIVIETGTTTSRSSALSLDFEPLRLLPTVFSGGATVYLYLKTKKQCDLVISASRERYNGKTPKVGILNSKTTGGVIEYFTLGVNSATTTRAVGAPFVACNLKPGLNVINLFPTDTGTAEISSFHIVPNVEDYLKFIESNSIAQVAYSADDDDNASIRRYVSDEVCVKATKKKRIFLMKNHYNSRGVAYRMRAKLNSGVVFYLGQAQSFGREWKESIQLTLTQSGVDLLSSAAMLDIFGVPTVIATNSLVADVTIDNRFDIFQSNSVFSIYINGALLISIPFCIGAFDLEIQAGAGSDCNISPIAELDDGASLFAAIDGETWVTYGATKRIWKRIAGTDYSSALI